MRITIFFLAVILFPFSAYSQEDELSKMLEAEMSDSLVKTFTASTFKGTRVINGQSVELPAKRVLQFLISHRFGRLNEGAYDFFGLDNATIRLGLDYGINNRLTAGVGRSSLLKAYDGYFKYKLLRQSSGPKSIPVSLVLYSNMTVNTQEQDSKMRDIKFIERLVYSHQLLIARKFSDRLSLQLMPTFIHRNVVPTAIDDNDIYAIGAATRFKLTQWLSLSGEYYYVIPAESSIKYYNSASIGVDIETGGHVFQLHFTNSQGMIESQFIPQTTGFWGNGDVHFGFNISRVFNIGGKKKSKEE